MALFKNHSRTIVHEATQFSDIETIKKEHGYMPFEGEGFIPGGKNYTEDSITWTEIRPIFRLNRKGELKLLGGIKYYVDKFAEYPEQGVWHPAHYHIRGLMTPAKYKEALREEILREERQGDGLAKRLKKLDRASAKEREDRETAVEEAVKSGKKRSEINVQDLRDAEGKARGRELAKILKRKYER